MKFLQFLLAGLLVVTTTVWADEVVSKDNAVTLHYVLTVDGQKVDSSPQDKPLQVNMGKNEVIPGFEAGLLGLKVGDKKGFDVAPDQGYGQVNEKARRDIKKEQMPKDVTPQVGMVLYIKGPDGRPYPVRIHKVEGDNVTLDFNHPLAGKTLHFDVEILGVDNR